MSWQHQRPRTAEPPPRNIHHSTGSDSNTRPRGHYAGHNITSIIILRGAPNLDFTPQPIGALLVHWLLHEERLHPIQQGRYFG